MSSAHICTDFFLSLLAVAFDYMYSVFGSALLVCLKLTEANKDLLLFPFYFVVYLNEISPVVIQYGL